jgi:endonuclease/exonuclease/phosphatase family metal-dependent hydrolase
MAFDRVVPRRYNNGAMNPRRFFTWLSILLMALAASPLAAVEQFTVATYNVENYLERPAEGRRAKTPEARARVREMLHALKADVLALVEMGGSDALLELRAALRAEGLDYPHWEHVSGYDTNLHLAVLSRFPFTARRPHTNDNFLLSGRRFQVRRGFAELEIQVTPRYQFTLFVAHLKSRRPVPEADQGELRLEEAKILREKIEARLKVRPDANLAVVGDFNDTKDSPALRALIGGRGPMALVDTRPAEPNGDSRRSERAGYAPANITWTYFYGREDSYERIDYILLSRGMAWEWVEEKTYVLAKPGWGQASDHRPIVATFTARDQ